MKIKIFIGGSTELKNEMDLFRTVANKLSVENDQKGIDIMFLAVTCTDFTLLFQDGGQQKLYDSFIQNQANLAFFIFDSKVGMESLKEFKLAYKNRQMVRRPDIQVFVKNNDKRDYVVNTLSEYVNMKENQYFTFYEDNNSLIYEVEKTLRCYIQPYSDGSSDYVNENELWGLVFKAQECMTNKPTQPDLALDICRNLVTKNMNNWRFYFSIGVLCAKQRTNKDFIEVALEAYEKARKCTFAETENIDESKIIVYAGAMKRRLWNLEEAIQDISEGYEKALTIPNSHIVKEDALKNLYVAYYLNHDSTKVDWVKSEMRKWIDTEEVEDIAKELDGVCERRLERRKDVC